MPTTHAIERKRARDEEDAADTSEDMPATQGARFRVHDLHYPFAFGKEILKERAERRDPGAKAHWDVAEARPLGGVDSAIAVWAAYRRKQIGPRLDRS